MARLDKPVPEAPARAERRSVRHVGKCLAAVSGGSGFSGIWLLEVDVFFLLVDVVSSDAVHLGKGSSLKLVLFAWPLDC